MSLTNKGFTLIELLVVVLIIAILAAVALPQYQKAVKRAQGREVLVHLNTFDKGFSTFALAHGSVKSGPPYIDFDELDITIPPLKHFILNHNRNYADVSMGVDYQSKTGEATVTAHWDPKTGKRTETTCIGNDCSAYFNCNMTSVKLCAGYPWDGTTDCPSHYISEAAICDL